MLFVEERTPKEIASQMDCSLQHVYKQRSRKADVREGR